MKSLLTQVGSLSIRTSITETALGLALTSLEPPSLSGFGIRERERLSTYGDNCESFGAGSIQYD